MSTETLERIVEPIELRPHHAFQVFCQDIITDNEKIRQELADLHYNARMINAILSVKERVLEDNAPIVLVPSIDDVCCYCNRWKRKKSLKKRCFGKDNINHIRQTGWILGMGFKIVYKPDNVISRLIWYNENELARTHSEKRLSNGMNARGYYMKRIEAYRALYENLIQK